MSGKFNMDDYVPVNERIEAFYARFPEGSIQGEVIELTPSRVTVKAFAYRNPDDEKPGIGHSSLDIPGATPYTRGSEVENAETSAWGRAIAALGFEVKRGIASSEEVRNKGGTGRSHDIPASVGSPSDTPAGRKAHTQAGAQYRRGELAALMAEHGLDNEAVLAIAGAIGIPANERPMSDASVDRLITAIQVSDGVPTAPAEGAAGSSAPPSPSTPPSGAETPDAATAQADEALPPQPPASSPSVDEVAAQVASLTGGEVIAPDPDEDPEGYRAWFAAQPSEVRAKLRGQGRAPAKAAA